MYVLRIPLDLGLDETLGSVRERVMRGLLGSLSVVVVRSPDRGLPNPRLKWRQGWCGRAQPTRICSRMHGHRVGERCWRSVREPFITFAHSNGTTTAEVAAAPEGRDTASGSSVTGVDAGSPVDVTFAP